MEPRGCNWSQSVANRSLRKGLRSARTLAADGKEGVDGSSPSEGLHKNPGNWHVALPVMARA